MPSLVGITSAEFVSSLKHQGFDLFVGVPCSLIADFTVQVAADPDLIYVPAVREDSAIGIAVGAFLAGKSPVVFMQNSAIGTCANAITSLVLPYAMPILFIITWRGYEGLDTEEHVITGKATLDLLHHLRLRHHALEADGVREAIEHAVHELREQRTPVALVIRQGVLR